MVITCTRFRRMAQYLCISGHYRRKRIFQTAHVEGSGRSKPSTRASLSCCVLSPIQYLHDHIWSGVMLRNLGPLTSGSSQIHVTHQFAGTDKILAQDDDMRWIHVLRFNEWNSSFPVAIIVNTYGFSGEKFTGFVYNPPCLLSFTNINCRGCFALSSTMSLEKAPGISGYDRRSYEIR